MSNELAVVEQEQEVTPMALIQRAAAQGASVEMMAQLFDLKLRVEADEARKAFNASMAQFKADPPRINKNISKKAGSIDLHYASIDNVVETITPALSKVGVRHRWETKQDGGTVSVTCILSHDMGHSESTTLVGPADSSGSKNAIQAIGSTVTYLQRYTLLAATGLAASGTDDDGGKGSKEGMPESELVTHLDNIRASANETELKKTYSTGYKRAAETFGDKSAIADIIKAKNQRQKDLVAE
jgi:hypothetical protein